MNNENNNTIDHDLSTLETEIHDAVAHGTNVKEAVKHLTLKAMNADRLDTESIQRIVTAAMQGVREGANHQLQQTKDQSEIAQKQIVEAIAGLDSALAKLAEASKLAMEEATSQTHHFSDTELNRVRSDLEGLESIFLDTLKDTAATTKGIAADTLHDLAQHAQNNGTAVGEQLKETLVTLAQQMSLVGKAQLKAGINLTHETAIFLKEIASGIITGVEDRNKNNDNKH